jgi:hypothetical protein
VTLEQCRARHHDCEKVDRTLATLYADVSETEESQMVIADNRTTKPRTGAQEPQKLGRGCLIPGIAITSRLEATA